MRNVVIVAGCRTPIGTIGGQFKTLTPSELTIPVMQNLVKRADIDPAIIEDVIWGCNYQRTFKENNLARVAAVKYVSVTGQVSDRPFNGVNIVVTRNTDGTITTTKVVR